MLRPHHIPNRLVLYLSVIAILLGLGIAYWQSRDVDTGDPTIIRSITTPNESPQTFEVTPPTKSPAKTLNQTENEDTVCIQVITEARNPETGDTEDFPSPCDVPDGWEITH